MFENLKADFERVRNDRQPTMQLGVYRHSRMLQNLRIAFVPTMWAVICHRYCRWVRTLRIPVLKQLLAFVGVLWQRWVFLWTGVYMHNEAQIGPGFMIHSPYGVLVGPTKIGSNCTVGSGVLLAGGALEIGSNVYFEPGAKVIGNTKIGSNVVIVANSLVLSDVPDNVTMMGVPAKITSPADARFQEQSAVLTYGKKGAS